jgi:adenosylmethionine-8-amino-7-oxononanoate aminotransferase
LTPRDPGGAPAPGSAALVEHDREWLHEHAKAHLWRHFAPARVDREVPIIVRGEGCYVWDDRGNRYLDGLSALFCNNIGHGRVDVAQAGAEQAQELGFFTTWAYPHPRSIELATRIAGLAPEGLNRVFLTSGGSESVDTAIKLARHYHRLAGKPTKTKLIARTMSYHGTTYGAMAATGLTFLREPYEPMAPGVSHVPATNSYRLPEGHSPDEFAEAIVERILFEGPDTVAAVIVEPVQNGGGCIPAPPGYFARVREICDEFDVLFISDEVICSWARLGDWFGSLRYGYQPDLITTAKGLAGAYAAMGAVIASDRVAEPFSDGGPAFMHGFTFGGHPMSCAIALANIDVIEREGVNEHVRTHEPALRAMLDGLRDIPIVGDVRGDGYFMAIELVKDQRTKGRFAKEDADRLCAELTPAMFRGGLISRADNRGAPAIQLAPPCIAGPEEFEEIRLVLRPLLEETSRSMGCVGA